MTLNPADRDVMERAMYERRQKLAEEDEPKDERLREMIGEETGASNTFLAIETIQRSGEASLVDAPADAKTLAAKLREIAEGVIRDSAGALAKFAITFDPADHAVTVRFFRVRDLRAFRDRIKGGGIFTEADGEAIFALDAAASDQDQKAVERLRDGLLTGFRFENIETRETGAIVTFPTPGEAADFTDRFQAIPGLRRGKAENDREAQVFVPWDAIRLGD